jgi:hypothetical protein
MPYEGEFAGYKPLQRIAESQRVQQLLKKARVYQRTGSGAALVPKTKPISLGSLPKFVVAIDGSHAEVDVKNGYPSAKVGYCTVASVLLDLEQVGKLDENRPVDPRLFRKTEEASTIDSAFPGCNVVTRTNASAAVSFREALYENFHDLIIDAADGKSLLHTYEELLAKKPPSGSGELCPYAAEDCHQHLTIGAGVGTCVCPRQYPIYSTDALRIHERFHDFGTNGEAFGEVMQVWERVLLVHVLRWFERKNLLKQLYRMAFFIDGPLAVFGHPAWLSHAIKKELKRINAIVSAESGQDLLLLGIEKTGNFVSHFEDIDKTDTGEPAFKSGDYLLLTDAYIKERIIFSNSVKPYGEDTYFGRKFFYKTASGARIVATLPYLTDAQDSLASDDVGPYPSFGLICAILDKVVSSQYPNSLAPIISAHSHAAIPLHLGTKVLQQLAKALLKQ